MFRNLIFVWVCILLIACEREINITPVNKDSRLVVDAEIENGRAPIVVLSKSLNFFSTIDSAELANSYIRNATVSIQEGNTIYPLKEFEIRDTSGNRFYYYSTDPQAIPQLIGQFGKNYKLSINVEGISYTSETTIPLLTKTMDSIWWKPAPNNDDPKKVVLMARVQDPP